MQTGISNSGSQFVTVDEMINTKGFRFHPTDAEAIEMLWDKMVLDRDSVVQVGDGSLVQVITQLQDICQFEPWELPGLSELESGDNLWVTEKGYWNPTGKPRHIVTTYDGKEIIGSRQTLVFYRGRVSDQNKKENKTPWIIHEFQLTLNLPNPQSITLCKLKKKYGKVDVSTGDEEGQSSQSLHSNLENHGTNNAFLIPIPKEQLNPNETLTESEAINEYSGIQTQMTSNEQDDDEFVGSLLINNGDEIYTEQRSNQAYFGEENENSSWSSILTANDEKCSKGGGNQHSTILTENHVAEDLFPMEHWEFDEFSRHGLFMAELSPVPEAPENPDGVEHNHEFSTNEEDDEFWNSIFLTTDEVEACPDVFRSKQQNLAAD